jgi:hypothetical protein
MLRRGTAEVRVMNTGHMLTMLLGATVLGYAVLQYFAVGLPTPARWPKGEAISPSHSAVDGIALLNSMFS